MHTRSIPSLGWTASAKDGADRPQDIVTQRPIGSAKIYLMSAISFTSLPRTVSALHRLNDTSCLSDNDVFQDVVGETEPERPPYKNIPYFCIARRVTSWPKDCHVMRNKCGVPLCAREQHKSDQGLRATRSSVRQQKQRVHRAARKNTQATVKSMFAKY